jgi:bifunctional DNA-binding transcriptional regulator/antitoxin component of YhaV-PrlF toxin-antitoxin module
MTGHVFYRKVGRIKKSLYVNIPSKIARMLDITKGSSLHIMVQDGMVTLSKDQDNNSRDKPEPIPDPKDKQGNDKSGEDNLKRMLEGNHW